MQLTVLCLLFTAVAAFNPFIIMFRREPLDDCSPGDVHTCLVNLGYKYSTCQDDECRCRLVNTVGADCFATCPRDAFIKFLHVYDNARCAPMLVLTEATLVAEYTVTDPICQGVNSVEPTIVDKSGYLNTAWPETTNLEPMELNTAYPGLSLFSPVASDIGNEAPKSRGPGLLVNVVIVAYLVAVLVR